MEDVIHWVLRIGAFAGIGVFLWSVSDSLAEIARAFTRMAAAADRLAPKPPPDPSPPSGV